MIRLLGVLLVAALLSFPTTAQVLSVGEWLVDNDASEFEEVFLTPEMACGDYLDVDSDEDGDFDELYLGEYGGSRFGVSPLYSIPNETEVVISCFGLPTGAVIVRDVDNDQDADVLWVGVRGIDWDNTHMVEVYEHGYVSTFIDYDGDGHNEVIVQDSTRILFDWQVADWGLRSTDSSEAIYIGILNLNKQGMAASIIGNSDMDKDGEMEIVLLDIRKPKDIPAFNPGTHFDLDSDGDADLVLIKG